ncbi:MAG: hypothetical protein V1650_01030, partial [Candidatus Omnitrophota bacterium]
MRRMLKYIFMLAACLTFILWQKNCFAQAGVNLLNCQYPQEAEAGDGFDITFDMAISEPIQKECILFIHLVSRNPFIKIKANTMINADVALPYPIAKWKAGEAVKLGPFRVSIPVDTSPGEYTIEAGLVWMKQDKSGTVYNKLAFLNKDPAIRGWEVGRVKIIETAEEDFNKYKKDALRVYIQNSLIKVFPEKPFFLGEAKKEISLSLAKNEFESAQFSLVSTDIDLDDLKFDVSDFIQEAGQ